MIGEQLELFPELIALWYKEAKEAARICELIEMADEHDY